jgi:polyhydroxyalkanoate synthesis regulator protein
MPMFTSDLLSQMIRFYGNAMQGMMGKYLEGNIKAFTDMQAKLQDQARAMYGENNPASKDLWAQFLNFQGPAMQSMMGAYMEQSKKMFMQMQEQIESQTRNMFSGFQFPNFVAPAGRPGEKKEAEEQAPEKK